MEQDIRTDKSMTVGSLKKTGWQLEIPEDTFPEDGKFTMKALSESEAQRYQTDDFTFYGTPVEISFDGQEHTVLGAPVAVALQIPKNLIKDVAAEKLCLLPDSVDADKGTATVEVYHFSF